MDQSNPPASERQVAERQDAVRQDAVRQDGGRQAVDRQPAERSRASDQARTLEAVGRLAGRVAHDFNNALTAILGYAEILETSLASNAPGQSAARHIRRAAERAAGLTRQLLAFSRRQVVAPVLLDANGVVRELEPRLRREAGEGVRVVLDLRAEPLRVRAGAAQVEQVLLQLVMNARDAMPSGGTLRIETEMREVAVEDVPEDPEAPDRPPPGRYLEIAVSDTGAGMPPEVRRCLFEPFFTTKADGRSIGFGLAMVHGVVEQAGGLIRVSSEVGVGSRFEILLPRVVTAEDEAPAANAPRTARGSETVLLVEDESPIRSMMEEALRAEGYRVLSAAAAPEALQVAERHPGPIDLLLTDVVMPGMNGRDLWERLARVRAGARVLFVSGYTADEALDRGVRAASVAFLQKPFTPRDLCRKVGAVLGREAPAALGAVGPERR